jgi:hypothetical protein
MGLNESKPSPGVLRRRLLPLMHDIGKFIGNLGVAVDHVVGFRGRYRW